MSLINKEPFITPEMIAAWNAGVATELIGTITFKKSDFTNDTSNRYVANSTSTSLLSAIQNAGRIVVEVGFNGGSGNNITSSNECAVDDLKVSGVFNGSVYYGVDYTYTPFGYITIGASTMQTLCFINDSLYNRLDNSSKTVYVKIYKRG